MKKQFKISGMVLAGGRATRMNGQDKGLILYKGKTLVSYPLTVLNNTVVELFINANRNIAQYTQYGFKVISDNTKNFDGALAGILAVMNHCSHELLMVLPCDSPFVSEKHIEQFLNSNIVNHDVAIAFDGVQLQPVFMLIHTRVKNNLQQYLKNDNHKISDFLMQLNYTLVDFSNSPELFININTLAQLTQLENNHAP